MMRLPNKALQILKTLVDNGLMTKEGYTETEFSRDKLYLLSKLTPPTNGSLELAQRAAGGSGGLRTILNVKIDGELNPVNKKGDAVAIQGDSNIKFEGFKQGYSMPDLSKVSVVNEVEPLVRLLYEVQTIVRLIPTGYSLQRL